MVVVLLSAPLGSALTAAMGKRLLKQAAPPGEQPVYFDGINYVPIRPKTMIANFRRGRLEMTTERETVT